MWISANTFGQSLLKGIVCCTWLFRKLSEEFNGEVHRSLPVVMYEKSEDFRCCLKIRQIQLLLTTRYFVVLE